MMAQGGNGRLPENPNIGIDYSGSDLSEIWLAGGCFWGVEAYFARIPGVAKTDVGYANGKTESPSYQELKQTGHAETVHICYDPQQVSLEKLLTYYFAIIDPLSVNRQGGDVGTQYRTGIYYRSESDGETARRFIAAEQGKYDAPIAVEVKPLANYFSAEEYHQQYLEKNPGGYCHVDFSLLPKKPDNESKTYQKPPEETLRHTLSDIQYRVTQQSETEPPFANTYWDSREKGIYVDVVTGEPLFVSADKFDSGCGWPSFTKPVAENALREKVDETHRMIRTEVRSRIGNSHLGHVFADGPKETGGLRYCINSAALRFIPLAEMEREGYGRYLPLLKE